MFNQLRVEKVFNKSDHETHLDKTLEGCTLKTFCITHSTFKSCGGESYSQEPACFSVLQIWFKFA